VYRSGSGSGSDSGSGSCWAGEIDERTIAELGTYLHALHERTRGRASSDLVNREMRALNHEHIFRTPFDPGNGLDLDGLEPGLREAAERVRADATAMERIRALGERYLADGPCLLHGDFFPGSWLATDAGVRVIDPEFAFFGEPEFDLAAPVAHAALAGASFNEARQILEAYLEAYGDSTDRSLDRARIAGFAATEVLRRLLGVAQLPLPDLEGGRARLVERARLTLHSLNLEALW